MQVETYLLVPVKEVLKYDKKKKLISVNLDIKNPNSLEALEHRPPGELVTNMLEKERRIIGIMGEINLLLAESCQ